MAHIEPNVIKRRLLATTPPTDILHKATLINVALVLVYNHDVMALPVAPQHTAELHKEVLSFLRTRQVDGQTKQKRRLVAKKPLSAGLEMGGLGIPHPDKTIRGFQQNLIQKIYKTGFHNPTASLPSRPLG
jgi:hypothetical protein